jgi:uncharacterized peroxidase-related enzyme
MPDRDADAGRTGSFLAAPPETPEMRQMYDDDTADLGYVMNLTRLWAHLPTQHEALFELASAAARAAGLSVRERGILVTAMASTLGDSYCALAWGEKLTAASEPAVAASVLTGADESLSPAEQALARWARRVTSDPSATTPSDVEELRAAGYDDAQIVAITLFVGLRITFSTVNAALGSRPDAELGARLPRVVLDAVTWGRPLGE